MPTSIPYDPSLVLGNIVPLDKLADLLQVGGHLAKIDAAQDHLNDLISLKYSLDMTRNELFNMNINTGNLDSKIHDVGVKIEQAAEFYAQTSVEQNDAILALKETALSDKSKAGGKVSASVESPLDFARSKLNPFPISSDSLKMDSQYFSFDQNQQNSNQVMSAIKSFVSSTTGFLGAKHSEEAAAEAVKQVSKQRQEHSITGTLVFSVNCTHKNAAVYAPLVLDVDNAVRAWNALYPKQKLDINDPDQVLRAALQPVTDKDDSFSIISGSTYGSSFVGMVHVLNVTTTSSGEKMLDTAASLQAQFKVGGWFAHETGKFGVSSSFADDVESLLSRQNITSHVSIISMGCVPSLAANDVSLGVKAFADFDPNTNMEKLADLANATSSETQTVNSDANAARTGEQMVALQNATISSVMSSLSDIQDGQNKMLDINSLMNALTDFIKKVNRGDSGVPINYFLSPFNRARISRMWIEKYYPNKFNKPAEAEAKVDASDENE